MVTVYILKLEQDKYYVGKTYNTDNRIDSHIIGEGSEWTKLYKYISKIQIINFCDEYDEDKYTIMYMAKYGIDNVRGGSFCTIHIDLTIRNVIKRMIANANNTCFNCGGSHFVKNCTNNIKCVKNDIDIATTHKEEIIGNITNNNIFESVNNNEENIEADFTKNDISEPIINCTENIEGDITQNAISEPIINCTENSVVNTQVVAPIPKPAPNIKSYKCYKCGKFGHFAKNCNKKLCSRCGRNTHLQYQCYASTHLNGEYL
jgi:hypothetical protein